MKVRASETCLKDAEIIMIRQNARFRSSWEPGGDLITDGILTVRVAGVTVVNGVIGHSSCRQAFRVGKILK